jgi:hypothetical protein
VQNKFQEIKIFLYCRKAARAKDLVNTLSKTRYHKAFQRIQQIKNQQDEKYIFAKMLIPYGLQRF